MTTKEMLIQLLQGKKMAQVDWNGYRYIYLDDMTGHLRYISKDETHYAFAIYDDKTEWEEWEKPILNFKEKEYLNSVIKPFRDKMLYIIKRHDSDKEWINIEFTDSVGGFPSFESGQCTKVWTQIKNIL